MSKTTEKHKDFLQIAINYAHNSVSIDSQNKKNSSLLKRYYFENGNKIIFTLCSEIEENQIENFTIIRFLLTKKIIDTVTKEVKQEIEQTLILNSYLLSISIIQLNTFDKTKNDKSVQMLRLADFDFADEIKCEKIYQEAFGDFYNLLKFFAG